jgi:hypothetical protein
MAAMERNQYTASAYVDAASRDRRAGRGAVVVICGSDLLASALALRFRRTGYGVVLCDRVDPPGIWRGMTFTDAWYVGRSMLADQTACFCASLRSVRPLLDRGYTVATTWSANAIADALDAICIVDARSYDGSASAPLPPTHPVRDTDDSEARRCIRVPRERATLAPLRVRAGAAAGIRADSEGRFTTAHAIGDHVRSGDALGKFNGATIFAPCTGVLIGLAARGALIGSGAALAAVDLNGDRTRCFGPDQDALEFAGRLVESICGETALPV